MIYFIRQGSSGPIKIGYTKDILARISQLQTSSPLPITVLGLQKGDVSDEKRVHNHFASIRMRGEWFGQSEDDQSVIIKYMIINWYLESGIVVRTGLLIPFFLTQWCRCCGYNGISYDTRFFNQLIDSYSDEFCFNINGLIECTTLNKANRLFGGNDYIMPKDKAIIVLGVPTMKREKYTPVDLWNKYLQPLFGGATEYSLLRSNMIYSYMCGHCLLSNLDLLVEGESFDCGDLGRGVIISSPDDNGQNSTCMVGFDKGCIRSVFAYCILRMTPFQHRLQPGLKEHFDDIEFDYNLRDDEEEDLWQYVDEYRLHSTT